MTESLPPYSDQPPVPPAPQPYPTQPSPAQPYPPQPYSAQPYQPQPYAGAPYPGPAFGGPPPPPKRSWTGLIVGLAIGAVVLLVACGVGIVLIGRGAFENAAKDPNRATVDDCLTGTTPDELDPDNLTIVSCDDPVAHFKVVQVVEGKLRFEADDACTDDAAEYVFWTGREGQRGRVLCLAVA